MGTQEHPLNVSADIAAATPEDFIDTYRVALQTGQVSVEGQKTHSGLLRFEVTERQDGVPQKALIKFIPMTDNTCIAKIAPIERGVNVFLESPDPKYPYYPLCERFIEGFREHLDKFGYLADEEDQPTTTGVDGAAELSETESAAVEIGWKKRPSRCGQVVFWRLSCYT